MTLPFCFLSLFPSMIAHPTPCLRFFKPTTLLVVVYENICGNFFFSLPSSLPPSSPNPSLCLSPQEQRTWGNPCLSKIICNGKRWGGRTGRVGELTKPRKTHKTRQLNQGSVELFLSLPFNFVVGFLLSFCWFILWCLFIFVSLPNLTTFYFFCSSVWSSLSSCLHLYGFEFVSAQLLPSLWLGVILFCDGNVAIGAVWWCVLVVGWHVSLDISIVPALFLF